MDDIVLTKQNDVIVLSIPTKNKGKLRWKNRNDNSEYGKGFATTQNVFIEKSYLEWQIGYDMDVNSDKKRSVLSNLVFVGANGKNKNPYELSEILYAMIEVGILTINEVQQMKIEIENEHFSFDETFTIRTVPDDNFNVSGFSFHTQDIMLPTFSYFDSPRSVGVEISIQKQQYASGTQPMVYITIPICNFDNQSEIIGRTSNQTQIAKFIINIDNKNLITNLFRFFALCSAKHRHDVIQILNSILNE